eukprot:2832582-Rhodomonas_salina.6
MEGSVLLSEHRHGKAARLEAHVIRCTPSHNETHSTPQPHASRAQKCCAYYCGKSADGRLRPRDIDMCISLHELICNVGAGPSESTVHTRFVFCEVQITPVY